ncbi:hypothetical protein BN1708_020455, partial [Verticillium longisporum]
RLHDDPLDRQAHAPAHLGQLLCHLVHPRQRRRADGGAGPRRRPAGAALRPAAGPQAVGAAAVPRPHGLHHAVHAHQGHERRPLQQGQRHGL